MLLLEETGVPSENHRPVASYCQTLSHNVVSSIGTDGICSCKSNYHTITTPTTLLYRQKLCVKYSNQHMDVTGQRSIRFVYRDLLLLIKIITSLCRRLTSCYQEIIFNYLKSKIPPNHLLQSRPLYLN